MFSSSALVGPQKKTEKAAETRRQKLKSQSKLNKGLNSSTANKETRKTKGLAQRVKATSLYSHTTFTHIKFPKEHGRWNSTELKFTTRKEEDHPAHSSSSSNKARGVLTRANNDQDIQRKVIGSTFFTSELKKESNQKPEDNWKGHHQQSRHQLS